MDFFFFSREAKKRTSEIHNTTLSNGYLGSRNDEERSEMRYVMRIAVSVNHQIFERNLRLWDIPASMPL
jgi:hypothetical protein